MAPIVVLLHGFFGFDKFLLWDMFAGVKSHLEANGFEVVQPIVHPTREIEYRARQIDTLVCQQVGPDVPLHVIGHSMGGLDARFWASPAGLNRGHRILTITTLATPHLGSPLATRLPKLLLRSVASLARIGLKVPGLTAEDKRFLSFLIEDNWKAVEQLAPQYMCEVFNPIFIDHPSTVYRSVGAELRLRPLNMTNSLRVLINRVFRVFNEVNDGMVPYSSTLWGEVLPSVQADHGGIIGLRLVPGTKNPFDHLAFFLDLVQGSRAKKDRSILKE